MMSWLFRFVLFLPLIEVVGIILVWAAVGPWWTIGALVGGSLLGFVLLRISPLRTAVEVRAHVLRGEMPGPAMFGGLSLGLAGLLLLVPGFFTDFLALILLFGPARTLLFGRLPDGAAPPLRPPSAGQPPIEAVFRADHDEAP